MAIKAITTDFYGTLVRDNNGVVRDICKRISQSAVKRIVSPADVGYAWWSVVEQLMKSGTFYDSKTLEKKALEVIITEFNSVEEPDELYEEVMESYKKPLIYEDTQTFIENLPLDFAIIENMDKDLIEDAVYYTQIDCEKIISSDDVKAYKPDEKIFLKAAEVLGVKPSEILHVAGSMKYDIAPAKKLGMGTCWLNRNQKPRKGNMKPNLECASLFDLKMMIK